MRISFIGSTPVPPPTRAQAGTAIMVELGNGKRFFFDLGPGCLRNIIALQVPLQMVNDIFITHLHVDHFAGRVTALQACGVLNGRYDGVPSDGRAWLGGDADRARDRVVRGGSWHNDARALRAAYRDHFGRDVRVGLLGFRCARVQAGEGRSGGGGRGGAGAASGASKRRRPARRVAVAGVASCRTGCATLGVSGQGGDDMFRRSFEGPVFRRFRLFPNRYWTGKLRPLATSRSGTKRWMLTTSAFGLGRFYCSAPPVPLSTGPSGEGGRSGARLPDENRPDKPAHRIAHVNLHALQVGWKQDLFARRPPLMRRPRSVPGNRPLATRGVSRTPSCATKRLARDPRRARPSR